MIESILLQFPFEPIYIVKNKDGYSIIDGKQRIATMFLFMGYDALELEIKFSKTTRKDQEILSKFSLSSEGINEDL